jgi:hypothetical protein
MKQMHKNGISFQRILDIVAFSKSLGGSMGAAVEHRSQAWVNNAVPHEACLSERKIDADQGMS